MISKSAIPADGRLTSSLFCDQLPPRLTIMPSTPRCSRQVGDNPEVATQRCDIRLQSPQLSTRQFSSFQLRYSCLRNPHERCDVGLAQRRWTPRERPHRPLEVLFASSELLFSRLRARASARTHATVEIAAAPADARVSYKVDENPPTGSRPRSDYADTTDTFRPRCQRLIDNDAAPNAARVCSAMTSRASLKRRASSRYAPQTSPPVSV